LLGVQNDDSNLHNGNTANEISQLNSDSLISQSTSRLGHESVKKNTKYNIDFFLWVQNHDSNLSNGNTANGFFSAVRQSENLFRYEHQGF
jgi:hypothetical protein